MSLMQVDSHFAENARSLFRRAAERMTDVDDDPEGIVLLNVSRLLHAWDGPFFRMLAAGGGRFPDPSEPVPADREIALVDAALADCIGRAYPDLSRREAVELVHAAMRAVLRPEAGTAKDGDIPRAAGFFSDVDGTLSAALA